MKRRGRCLLTALLVAAFLLIYVPAPIEAAPAGLTIQECISVDGMNLGGYSEAQARNMLEKRETQLKEVAIKLTSEYGDVETTLGELGFFGDVDGAVREAAGYGNAGSILKRYREQQTDQALDVGIRRSVSNARIKTLVNDQLKKVFDGSEDAKLIKKSKTEVSVVPGEKSVRLDAEATTKAVDAVLSTDWDHSELEIPLVIVNNENGQTEALSYITDLLGTYTTEFGSGDSGRNQNIARASELMNGKIVYPGEEVSTYYTIDPIEDYNGYAMAGVFVNNEVVQGIGGGVCQMSTTLYNALLWAEVEIVKRDYHGLPVSYVPLSYDATMAGGYLDLIFRNNLEYPIYIEIDCNRDEGYITANIYGHEYRDPRRTIEFDNNIVEKIDPPEDEVTVDPEMAPGTEEVVSNGKTGYRTELWKYVYYDGELQDSVLINRSEYSATPKKIKKGPEAESTEESETTEETEVTEAIEDTEEPGGQEQPEEPGDPEGPGGPGGPEEPGGQEQPEEPGDPEGPGGNPGEDLPE
ncbi:MAG: VanW family protein [Eubacterium sp.]|nr:VanW family protein [Eubacterium sp.]